MRIARHVENAPDLSCPQGDFPGEINTYLMLTH